MRCSAVDRVKMGSMHEDGASRIKGKSLRFELAWIFPIIRVRLDNIRIHHDRCIFGYHHAIDHGIFFRSSRQCRCRRMKTQWFFHHLGKIWHGYDIRSGSRIFRTLVKIFVGKYQRGRWSFSDVVELFTLLPTESIGNILWKKSNVC